MRKAIQIKRLAKELQITQDDPISGITINTCGSDMGIWTAAVDGPSGTPYEGGVFRLVIKFPDEFPFRPPNVTFETKIYHPNIAADGNICMDILRDKWAPSLTVQKVLLSILSLMSTPNPDDPLEPEVAAMFKNDNAKYERIAILWTTEFARDV